MHCLIGRLPSNRRFLILLCWGCAVLCSSCTTITSKSEYPVSVESLPEGIDFVITNKEGFSIYKGTAPDVVLLPSSEGYFKKASYEVVFEYNQIPLEKVPLNSRLNRWYFGNLLMSGFGVIGMLVVDPLTGSMYNLPDEVRSSFGHEALAKVGYRPGGHALDKRTLLSKGKPAMTDTRRKIYLSTGYGLGEIDLGSEYIFRGDFEVKVLNLVGAMGYHFDNQVLLQADVSGVTSFSSWGAYDSYKTSIASLTVGYVFNVLQDIQVIPRVGISRWSLKGREGALLNLDEEATLRERGVDLVGGLDIAYPIMKNWALQMSYSNGAYNFGSLEAYSLGLKVNL